MKKIILEVEGNIITKELTNNSKILGREDFINLIPANKSEYISRNHLEIYYEEIIDQFLIKDLGSSNGTYLNQVDIRNKDKIPLKIGDKISLSKNFEILFRGEEKSYS